YEVEGTDEGRGAIEGYRVAAAEGRPFDVVLLDLTVTGGLGGRDAAEGIRRIDPEARMIASSGYSSDPALADPRRYGFQAALEKPFLVEDLARVLQDVLDADGTT
ncbi:response regulator, partial [bacterium]|nr:response regulator [bacterium]